MNLLETLRYIFKRERFTEEEQRVLGQRRPATISRLPTYIDERDLRIDSYVNGNGIAARTIVTHIPTGLSVTKEGHKSNRENRQEAIRELAGIIRERNSK